MSVRSLPVLAVVLLLLAPTVAAWTPDTHARLSSKALTDISPPPQESGKVSLGQRTLTSPEDVSSSGDGVKKSYRYMMRGRIPVLESCEWSNTYAVPQPGPNKKDALGRPYDRHTVDTVFTYGSMAPDELDVPAGLYSCMPGIDEFREFRHAYFIAAWTEASKWGNARQNMLAQYDEALAEFREGKNSDAFFRLGMGAHYLQDMGVPYHVGTSAGESLKKGIDNRFRGGTSMPMHDIYEKLVHVEMDDGRPWDTLLLQGLPEEPQADEPWHIAPWLARRSLDAGASLKRAFDADLGWQGEDAAFNGWEVDPAFRQTASYHKFTEVTQGRIVDTRQAVANYLLYALSQLPKVSVSNIGVLRGSQTSTITYDVTNDGEMTAKDLHVVALRKACGIPVNTWYSRWPGIPRSTCSKSLELLGVDVVTVDPDQTLSRSIPVDFRLHPSDIIFLQKDPGWGTAPTAGALMAAAAGIASPEAPSCENPEIYGCLLEADEALAIVEGEPVLQQPVFAPLPDLQVEDTSITVQPLLQRVLVEVENVGDVAAAQFNATLYHRDAATGALVPVSTQRSTTEVPPGGTTTLIFPYSGPMEPFVRVDEDDEAPEEEDVANNQATRVTTIVDTDRYLEDEEWRPSGDVVVAPGVVLTLDRSSLLLPSGASLRVEQGGTFVAYASNVTGPDAGSFFVSNGTTRILRSNVSNILGGLVSSGELRVENATIRATGPSPAMSVSAGTAFLHLSTVASEEGAALVALGGTVLSSSTTHSSRSGTAIDARGGQIHLSGGAATSSLVALRIGNATVRADAFRADPGEGRSDGASTTAVLLEGGSLHAKDLVVAHATRALVGSDGQVDLDHAQVAASALALLRGNATVRAIDSSLSGSVAANDAASFLQSAAVTTHVRSNGLPSVPVLDATVSWTDALGALRATGATGADGVIRHTVPLVTATASGLTQHAPYSLRAQANGAPTTLAVTPLPDVTSDVAVQVRPNLAVGHAEASLSSTGTPVLVAEVANRAAGPADATALRVYDGEILVAQTSLAALAGYAATSIAIPWPQGIGIRTFDVVVDPEGAIDESNETDNTVQMQGWVAQGSQVSSGPVELAGNLVVPAAVDLTLRDSLLHFTGIGGRPPLIAVAPGATLRMERATLTSPDASEDPAILLAGAGSWRDSALGRTATFVEGTLEAVNVSFAPVNSSAVVATPGAALTIRGSTFRSTAGGSVGITAASAALAVEDTELLDLGIGGIELADMASADLRGLRFANASFGVQLFNASILLRDSVLAGDVEDPMRVAGSNARALNVSQNVSEVWLDTSSTLAVQWHGRGSVEGVDGEPAPDVTVTMIDRTGVWVGQFQTGGDGLTQRVPLTQFLARDSNGDGAPTLPDERTPMDPYTFVAGAKSVSRGVPGNVVVDILQTYATDLATAAPYQEPAPGGTVVYTVEVRNDGNGNDTQTYEVLGAAAGWTASVAPAGLVLRPGETREVRVTVEAPDVANATSSFNLTATSEDGTTSVLRLDGKVGANVPPVPFFLAAPSATFRSEPLAFTELSTDLDGRVVAWRWDFGDGATSEEREPTHAYATLGNHTVTLQVRDNANATAAAQHVVQIFDRPPALRDGTVTPAMGNASTPFTFRAVYSDVDGDDAGPVHLVLDGVAHAMAAGSGTPTAGQVFEVTLTGLTSGEHQYRFEGLDAPGLRAQLPANFLLRGPRVDEDPTVGAFTFSPASGSGDTLFTLKATYADVEGSPPAYVRAVLAEGGDLDMVREDPSDTNYADGAVYVARGILPVRPSAQTLRLEASDGLHPVTTPLLVGPIVGGSSRLGDGSVSPRTAPPGSTFTFEVTYRDAGGVLPNAVDLLLDGSRVPMAFVSGDATAGALYRAQRALSTPGMRAYAFEATGAAGTARLPSAGALDGPLVNTAPDAALVVHEDGGTVASIVTIDGSASSDPESSAQSLDVRVDWGDGVVTPWSGLAALGHQYRAPGAYVIALTVRDPHGGTDVATDAITIAALAPRASFVVVPEAGAAEEGDGRGTVFSFLTGGSGDLQSDWSSLEGRWDWESDGTWDTPWRSLAAGATHAYTIAGEKQPRLEVRNPGGLTAQTERTVRVTGTLPLALGEPVDGSLFSRGQRQYYRLEVPGGLANVVVRLEQASQPGVDQDLFLQQGTKPDPADCDPPACQSSTTASTGGLEHVCVGLPRAGSYYVLVHAREHSVSAPPVAYELAAYADVVVPLAGEGPLPGAPALTLSSCMVQGVTRSVNGGSVATARVELNRPGRGAD